MSRSNRFRRSSLGYSGFGGGVGGAGIAASSAVGGLPSSPLMGGGAGTYTSTYTTAAANSYLRNYSNEFGGGSSYSSPARKHPLHSHSTAASGRYDGSKIDSMLAAAGITTTSGHSAVNADSGAIASTSRAGLRSASSYRGGAARSHQELNALEDHHHHLLTSGATSLERRLDRDLPSAGISWRSRPTTTTVGYGAADVASDRLSRLNDGGFRSLGADGFGRREPSLTRSEILGPSSTSFIVGSAPSFPREISSSLLASGGRDRHLSSSSALRADELERDFQQYVVGPTTLAGGLAGGSGIVPPVRDSRTVLRDAGLAPSPSRAELFATSSRPLSRALVNDGYRDGSGVNGCLNSDGLLPPRSPVMSAPQVRSSSRTRRTTTAAVEDLDMDLREGRSSSRMMHSRPPSSKVGVDPFDARGRASDPYEPRHKSSSAHDYDSDAYCETGRREIRPGSSMHQRYDRGATMDSPQFERKSRNTASNNPPRMARSNSFRDLRDLDGDRAHHSPSSSGRRGQRARHQTLAYGVSASDLEDARTKQQQAHNSFARRGSDGGGGGNGLSGSRDLAAEWRIAHQVPIVSASTPGVVSFKANKELQGFASDMSVAPQSAHPASAAALPSSLTIAELEREARSAVGGGGVLTAAATGGGGAGGVGQGDLIVLKKDDLNTILTTKPTLLIGREINLNDPSARSGAANPLTSCLRNAGGGGGGVAGIATSREVDFRKLWEDTQRENIRLRDELGRLRDDLGITRRKLDTAVHTTSMSGLTEAEMREKKVLEKKLSEMEEELKLLALSENLTDQQLEHLKNDNQRLRDENGALIRVISKLSKIPGGGAAAAAAGIAGAVMPGMPP